MMTSPVHYIVVGLLFGTVFLTLGVFLGIWISRTKEASKRAEPPPNKLTKADEEMHRIAEVVADFSQWTSVFNSEFTKFQSEMDELNLRASENSFAQTRDSIQRLLHQIIEANRQLKSRLDTAEKMLEEQTLMLSGYLTEARTDSLTGISNRRSFDQKLELFFQRWSETNAIFSLALIDIDHFKSVNDTYGHPVGDVVLRESAKLLTKLAGETSHVSRYGGEEFALLMPMDLDAAAEFSETIRQAFENFVIQAEDRSLQVTLAIGVSKILPPDRLGNLVRRADEALYSAKLAGRNRVFFHNGIVCQMYGSRGQSPAAIPADAPADVSADVSADVPADIPANVSVDIPELSSPQTLRDPPVAPAPSDRPSLVRAMRLDGIEEGEKTGSQHPLENEIRSRIERILNRS